MSGFSLDGYTTVNERIIQFYDKYPDGVITTHPAKVIEIGQQTFISVIAEVWTTTNGADAKAEAWEVFPGKTPYTRDSEMMNAATSAIGRALMQLGIGIDKAAASADEVRVAQERRTETPTPPKNQRFGPSEKQRDSILRMMGTVPLHHRERFLEAVVGFKTIEEFDRKAIDWFFETKTAGVVERYKALSDIWALEPEEDPWAVEGM